MSKHSIPMLLLFIIIGMIGYLVLTFFVCLFCINYEYTEKKNERLNQQERAKTKSLISRPPTRSYNSSSVSKTQYRSTSKSRAPVRSVTSKAVDPRQLEAQRKLIQALNGDRKTAYRLFIGLKEQYPGMTNTWYLEKALFDLERDRRI